MNIADTAVRNQILVFTIGESQYALNLDVVERVIRAVGITPLTNSPEIVLGIINVRGQIVTVVDICKRFQLPPHKLDINDRFIIAKTSRRQVAVIADSVKGIQELKEKDIVHSESVIPSSKYVKGVAKIEGNLLLIYDLEKFLSLDEEKQLEKSIGESGLK